MKNRIFQKNPLRRIQQKINTNIFVALIILMLSSLATILISPSLAESGNYIFNLLFLCLQVIVICAAIWPLVKQYPKLRLITNLSGGIFIAALILIRFTYKDQYSVVFIIICVIVFHLSMLYALMQHLFKKVSTQEKLLAAINFYLLTGITFSYIYFLVNIVNPEAFSLSIHGSYSWPKFIYYSFVTLSSLGYGDIVPKTPFAQSLSTLEVVTGQLSLAIMIARFVGQDREDSI